MLSYFTASTTIELICFIVSILCLIKDKNLVWRSMTLYLFVTCAAEFSGVYMARKFHYNQWVYNVFLLFETGFNNLMFFHLFGRYINSKPLIRSGLALFVLLYTSELAYHGFLVYNNFTFTVMSVIYVFYSLYYYYLLLNDGHYIRLKYYPSFWWVAGTLFFYFASTACNLFDEKLEHAMITKSLNVSYFVFKALNIIQYSCWSYSFICRKWLMPKTISQI